MSPNPSQTPSDIPVDEEQLSAFLDGELTPEESARLQSVLNEKGAENDRLKAWRQIGHDVRHAADSFQSPESASAIMEQVLLEAAPAGATSIAPATHPTDDSISGQRHVIAVIAALALTVVCGVSLVLVNESRTATNTPPLAMNVANAPDEASALDASDDSVLEYGIDSAGAESLSGFAAPAPTESSIAADAPAREETALALSDPQFRLQLVRMQVDNPVHAIGHLHQSMEPNDFLLSMPDDVSEFDDPAIGNDRFVVFFDADASETRRLLADLFRDSEEFRSIDWEPVDLQFGTRDEILLAVIQAIVEPMSPDEVFGRPFLVQTANGSEQIPGYREVFSTIEIENALRRNPIMDLPEQLELAGSPSIAPGSIESPAARSRQALPDIPGRGGDRDLTRNIATKPDAQAPLPKGPQSRNLDETLMQLGQSGSLRQKLDSYVRRSPQWNEDAESGENGPTTTIGGVVLLLETRSRQTEE